MNTATRSVAVVATKLPNIDRRALSQAWYSALHLAAPGGAAPAHPGGAASPGFVGGAGRPPSPAAGAAGSAPARASAAPPPAVLASAGRGRPEGVAALERRAPTGPLARRIERAIVRHGVHGQPGSAALAVDAGRGRVHVLIRTDGATTRIVALCAPQLRDKVDRALAQARFALAASASHVEAAS